MNSPGLKFESPQPNVIEGNFRQHKVKALVPLRAGGRVTQALNEKLSRKALLPVLFAHLLIFAALISAKPIKPSIEAAIKPMLVSLVNNPAPEPEIVPLLPTPPQPEPVIKKQKPKPVVKELTPEPQPVMAEQPAIPESAPVTPQPQQVAEKTPEAPMPAELPVAEPKIEPPRFGAAYLENPPPAYPAQSRRLGEEGRVLLRVLVSEKGNAETVEIEAGSSFERLDRAALETVKKWRFIPAKRNNQPISAYVIVPIKFSLES
jgi:protein TonB